MEVYNILQQLLIKLPQPDGRQLTCMITSTECFIHYCEAGWVTWDGMLEFMLKNHPGRIQDYVRGLQMKLNDSEMYKKDRYLTPYLEVYQYLEKQRVHLINKLYF